MNTRPGAEDGETVAHGKAVFVCHASEDAETALRLAEALDVAGMPAWIAPRDVPVGASFIEEVMVALTECPATVLLLSENSAESRHVISEMTVALAHRRRVYVFALDSASSRYGGLSPVWQYILAVPQVVPFPGPDAAAAAMTTGLGLPEAAVESEPTPSPTGPPQTRGTRSDGPQECLDEHRSLYEALDALGADEGVVALVGRVATRSGTCHESRPGTGYVSLRGRTDRPVVVYVRKSRVGLSLSRDRAAKLLGDGIGTSERTTPGRHYVRVTVEELASPSNAARVTDVVVEQMAADVEGAVPGRHPRSPVPAQRD